MSKYVNMGLLRTDSRKRQSLQSNKKDSKERAKLFLSGNVLVSLVSFHMKHVLKRFFLQVFTKTSAKYE